MHCRILYTRLREPVQCSADTSWSIHNLIFPATTYTAVGTKCRRSPASLQGEPARTASAAHFEWMNEYFIHQRRYNTVKTVKSRTVSTGRKGSKSAHNCPERYVNEETRYSLVDSFCRTIVSLFVVFSFRHSHTYSELHLKADGVSVSAVWNLQ